MNVDKAFILILCLRAIVSAKTAKEPVHRPKTKHFEATIGATEPESNMFLAFVFELGHSHGVCSGH